LRRRNRLATRCWCGAPLSGSAVDESAAAAVEAEDLFGPQPAGRVPPSAGAIRRLPGGVLRAEA
jgi:hypothetical protein